MIERAWETVELGGIGTLRQTKLTLDHFVKNPHSRMRVFLAVQVISSSVHEMMKGYVEGNGALTDEYSSLILIVSKLDKRIDMCNHPDKKGMFVLIVQDIRILLSLSQSYFYLQSGEIKFRAK